jgi:hypothetical protein
MPTLALPRSGAFFVVLILLIKYYVKYTHKRKPPEGGWFTDCLPMAGFCYRVFHHAIGF